MLLHSTVFKNFIVYHSKITLLWQKKIRKYHVSPTVWVYFKYFLKGCLRFGYRVVNHGQVVHKLTMAECQSDCKSNLDCHLFEWDQENKICRLAKKSSDGKYYITQAPNVLIGIPDCQIEEMWLKLIYVENADSADQTVSTNNDQNRISSNK